MGNQQHNEVGCILETAAAAATYSNLSLFYSLTVQPLPFPELTIAKPQIVLLACLLTENTAGLCKSPVPFRTWPLLGLGRQQ